MFLRSGCRFCFGRRSDVSSMFWTSVVQVEQMNKNVNHTRIKKLPTVRVGHFSSETTTKNIKRKYGHQCMTKAEKIRHQSFWIFKKLLKNRFEIRIALLVSSIGMPWLFLGTINRGKS